MAGDLVKHNDKYTYYTDPADILILKRNKNLQVRHDSTFQSRKWKGLIQNL
jgi:hypothetical protein